MAHLQLYKDREYSVHATDIHTSTHTHFSTTHPLVTFRWWWQTSACCLFLSAISLSVWPSHFLPFTADVNWLPNTFFFGVMTLFRSSSLLQNVEIRALSLCLQPSCDKWERGTAAIWSHTQRTHSHKMEDSLWKTATCGWSGVASTGFKVINLLVCVF